MPSTTPRLVFLLLILLPATGFAQLRKSGPARKAPVKSFKIQNARRHAVDTVSLPFWDDFSAVRNGRADSTLWIDNDKVFINDGQAINPPSLNVATFDGFNAAGRPYSNVVLETGYGDTLESQPIKLSEVLPQHKNSIYLSFFYQPGGNSEMPNPSDFLKLEFKAEGDETNDGWTEIYRFRAKSNTDPTKFYDTAIQIPATGPLNYFHKAFQFRFTSFGRISGAYDGWHLDYVYLNRRVNDNEEPRDPLLNINENDKNTNISDRAISTPFSSIFTNGYYAIPYQHFLLNVAGNLADPVLTLFNLIDAGFPQTSNYDSRATITSYTAGIPSIDFNGVVETDVSVSPPLPSREYATRQINVLPNSFTFSAADSVKIFTKVIVNSGDMDAGIDYFVRYTPINFLLNDSISKTFTLSDYYAYDDGVAEYSAALDAQGNQFAYRFVMDEAVGLKTLNGAYIHFPFASGTVPDNVQIYIFQNDNGKPDSASVYSQTIPVTRTTNNIFTKIDFSRNVIVSDTFYIGYLETQTGDASRVRIGLDASHDTGHHMYYRNTVYHQWQQNTGLEGSLMIRPRFGTADVIAGTDDEPKPVFIYPNPNRGEFYIKGTADNLQILSPAGQIINFTSERNNNNLKITLQGAAPGMYVVRYRSGSKVFTDKILVSQY